MINTQILNTYKKFCENEENHNQQQKDLYEGVKEENKIIKCGGRE